MQLAVRTIVVIADITTKVMDTFTKEGVPWLLVFDCLLYLANPERILQLLKGIGH